MPRDWISVSLDFYCDRGYSPRSFVGVADARRPKPFSIEREIAMSIHRVPSALMSLLAAFAKNGNGNGGGNGNGRGNGGGRANASAGSGSAPSGNDFGHARASGAV